VVALTLLRIGALALTGLELHGDEAQYWSWAQHFSFGYYTKPPLIAWIIGATTAVCGDGEACVRLSSPLLHGATAMGLYALGRVLGGSRNGPRVGMWAALLWITLPAVAFSSIIVSTDVPLLACWTAAVLALRLTLDKGRQGRWGWAAATGVAIGLGLLAKYAMVYFALGLALHMAAEPRDRWLLRDRRALLILGLALAVLLPNLAWNAGHDFATVQHLRANADLQGRPPSPLPMLEFLGQQLGVFGPIPFLVLLWRAVAWARGRASVAERYLLAYALPPLAVVTVQAFLSRAHANWAVAAYPTAAVLVALWLTEAGRSRAWRAWTIGPHLAVGVLALLLVAVSPDLVPSRLAPTVARLSGWDAAARELRPVLDRNPGLPVLTTDRMTMASLLYALRDRLREGDREPADTRTPTWIWDWNGRPENQYEIFDAFEPGPGAAAVLVTDWADPSPVLSQFSSVEKVADLSALRPGGNRTLTVWKVSNRR